MSYAENLYLITAPAAEPVSAAEAKAQLRVDHAAEDALISSQVVAARGHVERLTARQLITATWELRLDSFPADTCAIRIPKPPLQQVVSVKYVDADGVLQTLASTEYVVDAPVGPTAPWGRLWLEYLKTWPTVRDERNAVRIQFKAGYGDAGAAVPQELRNAILLKVGALYANREPGENDDQTLMALLWPYRMVEA